MTEAAPTTSNPFKTEPRMLGDRQRSSEEIVTSALKTLRQDVGPQEARTIDALLDSVAPANRSAGTIGNRFVQAETTRFYQRARDMPAGTTGQVLDGVSKILGAGDFKTFQVLQTVSDEISWIDGKAKGAYFKNPQQARAVDEVKRGLEHAAHQFMTPVTNGLIGPGTSRSILEEIPSREAKLHGEQHPTPGSMAIVQTLGQAMRNKAAAAADRTESLKRELQATPVSAGDNSARLEAHQKFSIARQFTETFQRTAKTLGEIETRVGTAASNWPSLIVREPKALLEPASPRSGVQALNIALPASVPDKSIQLKH